MLLPMNATTVECWLDDIVDLPACWNSEGCVAFDSAFIRHNAKSARARSGRKPTVTIGGPP